MKYLGSYANSALCKRGPTRPSNMKLSNFMGVGFKSYYGLAIGLEFEAGVPWNGVHSFRKVK